MSHDTTPLPDPAPAAAPPLVIAGHGTRDEAGAAVCLCLVDRVRTLLPGVRVEAGFVELTPPTIDEALSGVLADSPNAVVVPLMIGTGGHVREDIPEAIESGRRGRADATVVYTRHLGSPAPLVAAARQRIDAACAGWDPAEVAVVFVGRGCSVTDANADHVRLGRVLQDVGGYGRVLPAFIQVADPTVRESLDLAHLTGARRIVVMPHYLFPGRLATWVQAAATEWAAAHPDAQVRVADVLGDCPELAEVVVARYREGALHARTDLGSPAYLSGLLLRGRKVVAAGGGCVNRRRVPRLLAAGADVTVVAPRLHPALAELAAAGSIEWVARDVVESDLDDAWYVLAATDDPAVNARVAAAAEERHTFCVRADKASSGSAWTPATGELAGATIAVLSEHDPRRSAALRDRLVELAEADRG
ncbi:CbiX/SirB N-terminal domain-containing protein [Propionicicella superfundia]|uniref:CbiX/SirB N-terminal domain-containing protein n=1 Tax=Propionicicella superfundia TaxID=348582 RepID=UPI0004116627|nr:CbiX/SirB N-terminal domain-containing protein [Propionicicella superfundia]